MKIFIVIPFYNEKKHIVDVARSIVHEALPAILVDDGSKDNAGSQIADLKLHNLTLLTHRINLGKGAAMKTGAEYAFAKGADAVIFMDGDNQHKVSDIKKFVEILKQDKYDAVFGTRNYNYGVPLIRYLGNKFASILLSIFFRIYVSDVLCGFKALTKKAFREIYWESDGYGVETEMIARIGKNKLLFHEVPIEAVYHDKVKGVTVLDAFGIMWQIVKWRFTI